MSTFNDSIPDELCGCEFPNLVSDRVEVSVYMITYNHAEFIAQAIESVIKQKLDVPFELCIGEDDSTDGTREICVEYARKYPETIRLFLRRDEDKICINGAKTGKLNVLQTRRACRGVYIACLEGDDFWIDPYKLQKQFDYMEENPRLLLSGARCLLVDWEGAQTPSKIFPRNTSLKSLSCREVLELSGLPHTSTLFMRRDIVDMLPSWGNSVLQGDLFLLNIAVQQSNYIGVLPDVMSVYRVHSGGVMRGKEKGVRLEVELDFWLKFLLYAKEQNYGAGIKYGNLYVASKRLALSRNRNFWFWLKKLFLYIRGPFLLKRVIESRLLDCLSFVSRSSNS